MSDAPRDAPRKRTFRPVSGRVVLVLVSLLAAFLLIDSVVRGGLMQTLLVAPWVLLGVWIAYELSYVSSIKTDGRGAVVTNLLRVTSFGWTQVRDIEMRWQLVFRLSDGSDVTAMGGPARSRPTRASYRAGPSVTPAARVRDEIRETWQAAEEDAGAPIRRTWDWPALLALVIIVAWALGAFFITR